MDFTAEQQRMMRYAVANGGRYVAGQSEAVEWDELVGRGLARAPRRSRIGLSVFSLTIEGMEIARRLVRQSVTRAVA